MSNKTRKHIWPVSLVMSIAIIGTLAAFLVLASRTLGRPRPTASGLRARTTAPRPPMKSPTT